jgi:NAD-dependent deacetylase
MHHPFDDDDPATALDRAAAALRRADRVAVLTGAGVSAESGVPTFRGAGGLWEGHRVEEVATPEAFARDPTLVWKFYHARRAGLRAVKPNPGHLALVALEERWGERFTLATQNIDGLHRAAGSRRVLELHGNLARIRCTGCSQVADRGLEPLPPLPACDQCGALLRPDVVWFHEMLPQDIWTEAEAAVAACQCCLVVGTSSVVYPAAGLVDLARRAGATVIEVNLERTGAGGHGAIGLHGASGKLMPELVRQLGAHPASPGAG